MASTEDKLEQLRNQFWSGFRVPPLRTKRFRKVYFDWVEIEDRIAGPIYSVANSGDPSYIIASGETRFGGAKDADGFLNWYLEPVKRFRREVESHDPPSGVGRADKRLLLQRVEIQEQLGRVVASIIGVQQEQRNI